MKPKPLVQTTRQEARHYIDRNLVKYPIKGPLALMEGWVYSAPDVNSRTSVLVSSKETQYAFYGPASSTLGLTPNGVLVPVGGDVYLLLNSTGGFPYVDSGSKYRWARGMYNHPSFATVESFLGTTLLPSDFAVTTEFLQSVDTVNWKEYLGTDSPINNSHYRVRYVDNTVVDIFLEVNRWTKPKRDVDHNLDWSYASSTIVETYYLRVSLIGMFGFLMKHEGWAAVIGDPDVSIDEDGTFSPNLLDPNGWLSYTVDLIGNDLLQAKSRAGKGISDVLVSVMELPSNVKLIRGLPGRVRRLRKQLEYQRAVSRAGIRSGFRKRPGRDALIVTKASANYWLEGKYGWKQLYLDMQSLSLAMLRAIAKTRKTYTSGSREPESIGGGGESGLISDTITGGTGYYMYFVHGSVRHLAGVGVKPSWLDTFGERLFHTMGRANVIKAIWDAIPLTFISDLFVDVGSVFSAAFTNIYLWSRAWLTLKAEPSHFFVTCNSALSLADIALIQGDDNNEECWVLPPFLADEEEVVPLVGTVGFGIYFRFAYTEAGLRSLLPVVPKGVILDGKIKWQSVVDMVALLRQRL